ncbi:molybdopterin biosynthesis protein [Jannaschia pagri]|uniref:Molybdopterin biosynthesis protein n=1 Tax=Jannaschia pagri TaxID=2829797 RepID=A0ABQ4NR84_9RHOB|nr:MULTISPECIES: molybdopterin-binding protein [unclassified Jannaschia]GIT93088.1 molybdopterin biosynthesis protein [Jannaschia sp. AI_61]GIT96923.1 molybdopterin biosynthesis protein [Jannaschia sp. AI_62]
MRFGEVPLAAAEGAILAHSVVIPGGRLRKGAVLSAQDLEHLAAAGVDRITVAQLQPGDVPENAAAARLAQALCGQGLEVREAFTGRANLHATGPGVLRVDPDAIAAVNAVDPMITVATLPEWQRMEPGTMAATIKIISYAVPETALARACEAATGALARAAPTVSQADLIVTTLDGAPTGAEAIIARLQRFGVACTVQEVPHRTEALSQALARAQAPLRLILTASATSDPLDVGPAALTEAGGRLTRFGMPVDPGNLLFLGDLSDACVVGLPGCARSPALNGADWVLERVICGVPVTDADIAGMGVGGLLKEIPTRPQPRERRR